MLSASLVLSLAAAVLAGPGSNAPTDSLRQAIGCCYRQQYDSARALTEAMVRSHPQDPAVAYWQAALVQMLIYDSGDPALADSFQRLCSRAIALCRSRLAASPTDAAAQFYWGMTLLGSANLQAWQQNRLAAASSFTGAPKHIKAAVQLAPNNPDYAYGMGMVDYFQSFFGKLFGRKTGPGPIRLLRQAADRGVLSRESARYSLAWMLGEEGRYEEAVAECRRVLAQYPGNRSALRLMRDNLLRAGRYREVVDAGNQIESSIRAAYPNNRYGLAENWLKMAHAYEKLGKRDSAQVLCRRIVRWEPYAASTPWLPNYIKEARAMSRRLGL